MFVISKYKQEITVYISEGTKYFSAAPYVDEDRVIEPRSNLPLHTINENTVSVVSGNTRYFLNVGDAWKYALYWIIMIKYKQWFVKEFIPDAVMKGDGINDNGDFITFYQPQSLNRNDKVANMVLCRTEKIYPSIW